jgi:hypothetical protein
MITRQEILQEKWVPFLYDNAYAVSNFGRVASAAHGSIRVLNISDNGNGYKLVCTRKINRKNYYIHRLVATAFIPNPNNLPEVNHIDCDRSNNRVANLEWCTHDQNIKHSARLGKYKRRFINK